MWSLGYGKHGTLVTENTAKTSGVIPANAGIQTTIALAGSITAVIPANAGIQHAIAFAGSITVVIPANAGIQYVPSGAKRRIL
jgi:hypothetical protein